MTTDLLDEAAGPYDAIQLADAFSRLGSQLVSEVGSDVTTLGFTTLSRFLAPALGLLAEVVTRPRLADVDLTRVRELRLSRLRQLSSSASAAADRMFYGAVFGSHPYGHGVLGTTASLGAMALEDVREFRRNYFAPDEATLIVGGDADHDTIMAAAESALGQWPSERERGLAEIAHVVPAAPPKVEALLVHRPGAPQSELRIGHAGPARDTDAYHALITLNAALGGQFSSRLNTTLREKKGLTYGVHTAFDLRRKAGSFACETSVQANGTAEAIADVLAEFAAIRTESSLGDEELDRAKAALTRGYVRHFETAEQLVRAAVQLLTYGLDDRTFDRFVPAVQAVSAEEATAAARTYLHPDHAVAVVVGDADQCRGPIEALGLPVTIASAEF